MLFKFLYDRKYRKKISRPKGEPKNFLAIEKDKGISKSLSKNIQSIKEALSESADIKTKQVVFGKNSAYKGVVLYIDGLVENDLISQTIIKPLTYFENFNVKASCDETIEIIKNQIFCSTEIESAKKLSEVVKGILKGDSIFILDTCNKALIINTKGGEKRSITEPQSESVVRGPREGFTENFRANTALIRRKIRNGKLKIEEMTIGRKSQTVISILYLEKVVKPEILKNLKTRLENLEVESILESGYLEQYIEDNPLSPFPTIDYSEKPDVIAAKILEGRIAIVVDGTPFVLTVPMLFVESFQTAEDYYNRPIYASIIRILRYFAYLISILGPAIYISLTNFHQELIPTTLLFSIIRSKEGTPFPIFVETLIMVFAFEFLREAGIRLPKSVGQAVSIVGALIMGEAAVSAGIVGAPIVIVVAFTAVCGFMVPMQNNSSSIIRLLMIFLASFAGWYGVSMGFLAILIHLASLKSFGVPYFDSFSGKFEFKDTVIRVPLWQNQRRPVNLAGKDKTRTNKFVPPNTFTLYNNKENKN